MKSKDTYMRFEDIEEKLCDIDCVSFDVFDTLLLRPFVNPEDIFDYIGEINNVSDFRKMRVKAENECRHVHSGEITLNEIYSYLGDELLFMKDKEVSAECRLSIANPEVMDIYRKVSASGKKIIAVSDMYLPLSVIETMLRKNGYCDHVLYVSSEYGFCKHDGSLYEHVLKDMKVDAGRLLHIGDNFHSDLKMPLSLGVKALRYVPLREQYFHSCHREFKFYHRNKSLGSSVVVAMDMLQWLRKKYDNSDYWYDLGYRFGGPVSSFFVRNMMSVVPEDTDRIFFVSRDGYNLEKVYKILCSAPIENRYVHASRFFSAIFGDMMDDSSYAKMIFEYFSNNPKVKTLNPGKGASNDRYIRAFKDNQDVFLPLIAREKERFRQYIKKIAGDAKRIMVVDATTMKYSSQRLLQGALGTCVQTIGYYYHVMANGRLNHMEYRDCSQKSFNWTYVNVVEFFLGSPEYPIRDISDDGSPIYMEDVPEDEIYRAKIYPDVTRGEEDYANCLKDVFGDEIPLVKSDIIHKWLHVLVDGSRVSNDEFSKMRWSSDADHSIYHGLIFGPADVYYVLRSKVGEIFWKMKNKG